MNRYGRAYVYYRCTYKNPTVVCNQGSVTQDELERQILAFLDSIYIDKETHLPVRIETYDWPKPGGNPNGDMMESYSYINMRVNVGLGDESFNY